MVLFKTEKEYLEYFQEALEGKQQESPALDAYVNKQCVRLTQLVTAISQETFWVLAPEILGIDAKLSLLIELIQFEDFSSEELIRIVENDYRSYFKELCGYDLKMEPKHSMIFNVV